jgi:Ca-activated chloride channel family protein
MMKRNCALAMVLGVLVFPAALLAAELSLSVDMERPVLQAGPRQITYIKVGLTGFEWDRGSQRPPLNVALVLDRSGSMEGEKLERAKEAAKAAVGYLTQRDVLSIVAYESGVRVILPATRVTDKPGIMRAIDRIESDGSTALFAGVSSGARELRKFMGRERVNRVILLSDGQANVGPDSTDDLVSLGQSLRREGMSVTTIGLGLDYNEDLMAGLAQASDGNHAFVQEPEDLARIFNLEFKDACEVVAQDVRLRIKCSSGIRPLRVLNREGEIRDGEIILSLNNVYSMQDRYFLIEVEVPPTVDGQSLKVAEVKADYLNMSSAKRSAISSLVSARASASQRESAASRNKEVVEKVAVQKAVIASEEAVQLRDKGDAPAARAILEQSAADLDALSSEIGSVELKKESAKSANAAQGVSDDEAEWNASRKSMKESQYETKNQQRY